MVAITRERSSGTSAHEYKQVTLFGMSVATGEVRGKRITGMDSPRTLVNYDRGSISNRGEVHVGVVSGGPTSFTRAISERFNASELPNFSDHVSKGSFLRRTRRDDEKPFLEHSLAAAHILPIAGGVYNIETAISEKGAMLVLDSTGKIVREVRANIDVKDTAESRAARTIQAEDGQILVFLSNYVFADVITREIASGHTLSQIDDSLNAHSQEIGFTPQAYAIVNLHKQDTNEAVLTLPHTPFIGKLTKTLSA